MLFQDFEAVPTKIIYFQLFYFMLYLRQVFGLS